MSLTLTIIAICSVISVILQATNTALLNGIANIAIEANRLDD